MRLRPLRAARLAGLARGILAALVLGAAAYAFLASGNASDRARGLVASWQAFPALASVLRALAQGAALGAASGTALAFTAAVAAAALALAALALSALFGRWYCALLCPLGALQDLSFWLGRKKPRYRRPATRTRIISALCAIALSLLGAMAAASWLDPWSLFGRFMSYDLRPLARLAAGADALGFSPWTAAAAASAMATILALALLRGRWFCGALCPVGSLLGLLNRAAPLRLRLDAGACISCGACEAACPASCIEVAAKRLDDSRCVYCLACVGACPTSALRYGLSRKAPRPLTDRPLTDRPPRPLTRAGFLAALGGGAALLALSAFPGRALASRLAAPRLGASVSPTLPPGARSLERFLGSCTACGLCASACPSGVLQPSLGQLGPRGLLAPRLDYSISYCQYECTTCLDLCPSGALERMSLERKKLVKIGDATLVKDLCIVFTSKTKCGACAEHCPTGAVRMIPSPTGIPEPLFTTAICIGCGACHHACPVKPERAITVAGLALHEAAAKPTAALLGETGGGAGEAAGIQAGGEEFPF